MSITSTERNSLLFLHTIYDFLTTFPSITISFCFQSNDSPFVLTTNYECFRKWRSIKRHCRYHRNYKNPSLALCNTYSHEIVLWLTEPYKFCLIPTLEDNNLSQSEKSVYFEKLKKRTLKIAQPNVLQPITFAIKSSSNDVDMSLIHDAEVESLRELIRPIIEETNNPETMSPMVRSAIDNVIKANNPISSLFSSKMLQIPVEHLAENHENTMYANDTHKYDQYERAFMKALNDLVLTMKAGELKHILFVDPRRGPLIERLFAALETLSISVLNFTITAIESNHNLIHVLKRKNRTLWNGKVKILGMEFSRYPQSKQYKKYGKVHLVISDLMGSFGCDELMPESLDSIAIPGVCSSECIFIPYSIESYLAPVSAPLLWEYARGKNIENRMEQIYIPLIPLMKSHGSKLSWSSKSCLSLKYPTVSNLSSSNFHNSRLSALSYDIPYPATIDGLAGYFTATLYPGSEARSYNY